MLGAWRVGTVLVLGLVLVAGSALAAPEKPKKTPTKVTIKFVAGTSPPGEYVPPGDYPPPPSPPPEYPLSGSPRPDFRQGSADRFQGKVKPKSESRKIKRKCRKNRTLKVKRVGGAAIGTAKTNKRGRYEITIANASAGRYLARAKKRAVEVKGDEVICKRAKSKRITVSG